MKNYNLIQKVLFSLAVILLVALQTSHAQVTKANKEQAKAVQVKQQIDSKHYIFIAQSVLPSRGMSRQLTSGEYDVRIAGDTLAVYLPYFGRAYSAPMDPTQGGIKFTSVSFDYTVQAAKKGNRLISIKPRDGGDVRQLLLTVSESGYASLQVTSNNREPISFNGYITAPDPKKKSRR